MVNIADIAGIASVLTPNPTLTSGLRVLGSGAPTSSSAFNPFSWLGENPTPDAIKAIEDYFKKDSGGESVWDFSKIIPIVGGLGGGLMGLFGGDSTANQPQGYQGGIPRYTAQRTPIQQTYDPNRRPGSGGRRYFSDVDFQPVEAAQGGIVTLQQGGRTSSMPRGVRDLAEGVRNQAIRNYTSRRMYDSPSGETLEIMDEIINRGFLLERATDEAERERLDLTNQAAIRTGAAVNGVHPAQFEYAVGLERKRRAQATVPQQGPDRNMLRFPSQATNDPLQPPNRPQGMKSGGLASLRPKGMYLGGKTDGMADQVPATISNRQPARLSDGEFVIPADVVSHLGNGNSDAGAKELFSMMDRVRVDRTGNPAQGSQINPSKYLA
jgi:hypothetical protein